MKKEVSSKPWGAPWFIRGVIRVLCLLGLVMIGYSLWIQAHLIVGVLVLVFFLVTFLVATPFRRFGSKYFSREAIHVDKNLVELDLAGTEYWNDDPVIKDYFGTLELVKFSMFLAYDRSVRIGALVQRLGVCVKISFDGTDPEKTLNLFKSMRVIDPNASPSWRKWLKEHLSPKIANVVTTLAIEGKLSRFIHENMDGEFLELIQRATEPELNLIGGGFVVKASYQLLDSSDDVDEFYLSEKADIASANQVRHVQGTLPCIPKN